MEAIAIISYAANIGINVGSVKCNIGPNCIACGPCGLTIDEVTAAWNRRSPIEGDVGVSEAELVNEIWETLFAATKDNVPEALTDELLMTVAKALLAGHTIARRSA